MSANKRSVVEVGALAPLDAKAARVLGGGVHWEPKVVRPSNHVREEEGIPPMRAIPAGMLPEMNLTGQRFGRFVVKGLAVLKDPARWVVRCDCGAYEHRKASSLKKLPPERNHCSHCDYLIELKAGRVTNRGPFNKADKPPDT